MYKIKATQIATINNEARYVLVLYSINAFCFFKNNGQELDRFQFTLSRHTNNLTQQTLYQYLVSNIPSSSVLALRETKYWKLKLAHRLQTLLTTDKFSISDFKQMYREAITLDKESIGFNEYPAGRLGKIFVNIHLRYDTNFLNQYTEDRKRQLHQQEMLVRGMDFS